MKFYYKHIVLWLNNGKKRQLNFEPNRVNVITGGSNTGKTAILQIIDYCLFASEAKIAESVINENVSWYGLVIGVNDKEYTICRTALNEGKVTDNYYFSSIGEVPDMPIVNNDADTIKSLLEEEFSIDSKISVPFGGSYLKAGSKFSLRYFLMFTTISQDIITNSSIFFDHQDKGRYREALERIFDLAIGVDTIENILAKERTSTLEAELKKQERKRERYVGKKAEFERELEELIRISKEYELISPNLDSDASLKALREVIKTFSSMLDDKPEEGLDALKQVENLARLTIRNLERLHASYRKYKKTLEVTQDSLMPIEYIQRKKNELVQTSIFSGLVDSLEKDLLDIKNDMKGRTAIECNISDLIASEELKIKRIKEKIAILPQDSRAFNSDRDKHFFMGQLATKLDLYSASPKSPDKNIQKKIDATTADLERISVTDVSEKRGIMVSLLEEFAQKYITMAGDSLENYKDYLAAFDYKKKSLSLRKPLTTHVDSVGSSSNHLYLHLFLFLGLHELFKVEQVPFVPPYLIIDQPSRPYWGEKGAEEGALKTGDESKIKKVFEILDAFVKDIIDEDEDGFQMIVLEHVPESYWKSSENICLVEEFIPGGNALIPADMLAELEKENEGDFEKDEPGSLDVGGGVRSEY